jgi:hypothetical protein
MAVEPAEQLAEAWGTRPLAFPHFLADPAGVPLTPAALAPLLRSLPARNLIIRETAAAPGAEMVKQSELPEDLEGLLRSRCMHIMVLDLQERSPAFAALLERFVAAALPALERRGERLVRPMIGLFLSSPGSIAHYHADPEHNFLLQILGEKEVHVFPNDDEAMFSSEARERLFCERKHSLDYRPEFEQRAWVFHVKPGMSSYQPALCPHWVKVGAEPSLSIGVSLFAGREERQKRVHLFNHWLRGMGVQPTPPGRSPARDGFKRALIGVAQSVRGRRA